MPLRRLPGALQRENPLNINQKEEKRCCVIRNANWKARSPMSANHIDQFVNRRLKHLRPQFEHVLPVLVTHMISSEPVAAYAKKHGIALYYSYQF